VISGKKPAKVGDLIRVKWHMTSMLEGRTGLIIEVITIPHPSWGDAYNEYVYVALVEGVPRTLHSREQFEILRK